MRRLSILLTGDVPLRHLMRPVHSAGRRRAYLVRTVTPVLQGAPCPSTLEHCQGSFPCMPTLRGSRMSGRKEIALATNISCTKCYICYVPGPTCRGSALLYMAPLNYKRGGMQRY
jgi:hypothetical protein